MVKLAFISLTILIINTPFGYWRANVKKYSIQWVLAIHIPVLIGTTERVVSHLEFSWATLPIFILVFFTGQFLGGKLYHFLKDKKHFQVSSCLVMDCLRNCH